MTAGGEDGSATPSALQHPTLGNAPTVRANLIARYGMTLDAQ